MLKSQHQSSSGSASYTHSHSAPRKALEDFDIIDDSRETREGDDGLSNAPTDSWRVLIVDDDQEVHDATRFALKNLRIFDRPLELLHAYTGAQGMEIVRKEPNIAVALLDVVMESEQAGLKLVQQIRNEGFNEVRIVLRTGQPGYAPEQSVLRDYDINDYRTKSELTRGRLISLLTTSFRSYQQLHIINENRRGLAMIVESAAELFKRKNLESFSQGVLIQLIGLVGGQAEGVACLFTNEYDTQSAREEFRIVTATGRFAALADSAFDEIDDVDVVDTFYRAQKAAGGVYLSRHSGFYFSSREGKQLFIYLNCCDSFSHEMASLLQVFAGNVAVGFENQALIEKLDHLAYMDSMLNIPNRNAFAMEFDKLKKTQAYLGLVVVHVNALSQSISVFGVPLISKAILRLRDRIATELRPAPFFIGYDGKADLLLLVDYRTADINGINAIFDARISIESIELPLTATIGIVEIRPDMDAETALRYSSSALTIAKGTPGSNVMYYDQSMSQGLTERILLQSALRHALENRIGIEAWFQPKVKCSDGSLVGAEALCRWMLDGRRIDPKDFIPIAEAGGLSSRLTDVMLEHVGAFVRNREQAGLPALRVALNLSMRDLHTPQFARMLNRKCRSLGLTPETVEFEITETAMMDDPAYTIKELSRLKDYGYLISIDDFGTGFSALNYLERLPVNSLKIDKAFIDSLTVHSAKRSLAATTIAIAERMGLFVVAEGIETKEQYDALLLLGCDVCQGYYFGKPMPAEVFNETFQLGPVKKGT